jgi:hypothetical protein
MVALRLHAVKEKLDPSQRLADFEAKLGQKKVKWL